VQRGPHALEACPGRKTRQGNAASDFRNHCD
jgi:hypothetical protein